MMPAPADDGAPGAAVTVALCGHWEHPPPCPLAPHHTRAELLATTRLGLEFNDAARAEVVAGTNGNSKNQSHAWRVSRHGGLSRTAFRPMDSKSMVRAWEKTITPTEAARIRAITAGVADRCYGPADW